MLPGTSTVAEHLHFHARVRLPWLPQEQRAALVASTLTALSLTRKAPIIRHRRLATDAQTSARFGSSRLHPGSG